MLPFMDTHEEEIRLKTKPAKTNINKNESNIIHHYWRSWNFEQAVILFVKVVWNLSDEIQMLFGV